VGNTANRALRAPIAKHENRNAPLICNSSVEGLPSGACRFPGFNRTRAAKISGFFRSADGVESAA